jgi:hypothetical protein
VSWGARTAHQRDGADRERRDREIPDGGRRARRARKPEVRSTTGTVTLATPAGDVTGSIEIQNALPNKTRTLIKADLTALGAGPLTIDQRFDGNTGYVLDNLQGNRDITGNQLDNLRNGGFPHPFLNYKEMGTNVQLAGKEKIGDREAYVLIFDPALGSAVRQYIDAETYMPVQMSIKVEIPQLGQQVEQTTEFLDYRGRWDQAPFRLKVTSTVQNFTIRSAKVEHNVPIDESLFSKPATP